MTTTLETTLGAALEDIQLLSHPFYQRWEAGTLRREELTRYAEQYRYFEEMLPGFLDELAAQLPEGPIRGLVLDNLTDEVAAPSHLSLFEKFATFFDATTAPISPAMLHLVNAYRVLLERGPAASLGGLWAYESQGAKIADSKAQRLVTHFEADVEAVEFWSVHGSLEGDHAGWTMEALVQLDPDANDVTAATRLIGEAWWSFLDEREALAA